MPQLNEVGKPTPQKTKAPAKAGSAGVARARRTDPAERHSARRRRLPPNPVGRRRGDHASQRPLLCVAPAGGAAYRERQPLCHPGRLPVRPQSPPAAQPLAPHRRADRDPMWSGGGAFGAVDDPVLSLACR